MKIQYMSDLHLEFDRPAILKGGEGFPVPEKKGDILVLAGDIDVGTTGSHWVNRCADRFEHVILLFGNHEFYHNDMVDVRWEMISLLNDNVELLDPGYVDIDGIRFVGNTLWSDMDGAAFNGMNDSRIIQNGEDRLSLYDVRSMFKLNVAYIQDNLSEDMPNVVITHHAPDIRMCDLDRYGVSYMNSGYATDILDKFTGFKIPLWISGHTHAVMDQVLRGVRCVSNCRGYANHDEVVGFDPNKVVEV